MCLCLLLLLLLYCRMRMRRCTHQELTVSIPDFRALKVRAGFAMTKQFEEMSLYNRIESLTYLVGIDFLK